MRNKPGIRERIERDRAIADSARAGGQTRRQLAERDLAQVRRCIDQNLATLREAAGEWPEGWLHQHAAKAIAVSSDESLPDQVRFQALLQYVAIQVLEAERLELALMGEG